MAEDQVGYGAEDRILSTSGNEDCEGDDVAQGLAIAPMRVCKGHTHDEGEGRHLDCWFKPISTRK